MGEVRHNQPGGCSKAAFVVIGALLGPFLLFGVGGFLNWLLP